MVKKQSRNLLQQLTRHPQESKGILDMGDLQASITSELQGKNSSIMETQAISLIYTVQDILGFFELSYHISEVFFL